MYVTVSIHDVKVRENWNIRAKAKMKDIDSLAESIKSSGRLIHPISINTKNELICGHRRLEACKRLGWTTIPAIKQNFLSDIHERIAHLDENMQSMALKGAELDKAIYERKLLFDKLFPKKSAEEISDDEKDFHELPQTSFIKDTMEKTGQSRNSVKNKVDRMEKASEKVKDAYHNKEINQSQVSAVIKLPKDRQDEVVDLIKDKNLNETKKIINDAILGSVEVVECSEQKINEDKKLRDLIKNIELTNSMLRDFLKKPYHEDFGQTLYDKFVSVMTKIGNTVTTVVRELNSDVESEDESDVVDVEYIDD